jgi:hypothetical protein
MRALKARFTATVIENDLGGSFNLSAGGPRSSLMNVSPLRARAAGLTLTDPAVTAKDTRDWILGKDLTLALSPEREADLIRIARQEERRRSRTDS